MDTIIIIINIKMASPKIKQIKGMKDIFELYPYYRHVQKRSVGVLETKYNYKRLL